jgi:hypothetical protein
MIMNIKLIDIADAKVFPEPRVLTAEEEAAIIAQCRAEIDPVQLEAECSELLAQHNRGELVDAEEHLRQMGVDLDEGKPA